MVAALVAALLGSPGRAPNAAPAGPRCKGCEKCPAPLASLAAADVDPATGVLLLEIEYDGGTDRCWEPDQTFHVVRLRP